MKVLLIGATAGTGRALLDELLDAGHEVTALSRSADGLPAREGLTAVAGDATDVTTLSRALDGQDGVAVAVGFTGNPLKARIGRADEEQVTVHSRVVDALLLANDGTPLRTVYLSAFGAGTHADHVSPLMRAAYWAFLKPISADHARAEQLLRGSALDWTVVQPVGLTDGAATGDVVVSPQGATRSMRVSRADVARVMAQALADGSWSREVVAVSG